jgi:hypothetical protein
VNVQCHQSEIEGPGAAGGDYFPSAPPIPPHLDNDDIRKFSVYKSKMK